VRFIKKRCAGKRNCFESLSASGFGEGDADAKRFSEVFFRLAKTFSSGYTVCGVKDDS
jgi:hypothetical protein